MNKKLMVLTLCLLAGCAAQKEHDRGLASANAIMDQNGIGPAEIRQRPALPPIELDAPRMLGTSIKRPGLGEMLPGEFDAPNGWTFTHKGIITIEGIKALIQKHTDIPVEIEDRQTTKPASGTTNSQSPIPAPPPSGQNGQLQPGAGSALLAAALTQIGPATQSGNSAGSAYHLEPYSGPLTRWLVKTLPQFGYHAQYHQGRLYFRTSITRDYQLAIFTAKTTVHAGTPAGGNSTASGLGQNSTGSGGSSRLTAAQDSSSTEEIDPPGEIKSALETINPNCTSSLARSHGLLTVTCPNEASADRVDSWVSAYNSRTSRQIAINVTFLTVTKTFANQLAFQGAFSFKDASGALFSLSSPIGAVAGAGSIGAMVLNAPTGTQAANWNGTSAFINALDQSGDLVDHTPISRIIDNGRASIVRDVTSIPSVSQGTSNLNATLSQTVQQVTSIDVGQVVTLNGRIMDDGRIRVEVSWSISNVTNKETRSSSSGTLDLITTHGNSSDPISRTVLPGYTYVLVDQATESSSSTRNGDGFSAPFGFGRQANSSKTHQLVLLSAREMTSDLPGRGTAP